MLVLGTLFLSFNFITFAWHIFWKVWPAALILFGIWLIVRKRTVAEADDRDRVEIVSIFGGNERRVTSQSFRGGNVVCIFGGVDVDLGEARLAEGEQVLEVVAIFGGADIHVPEGSNVEVRGVAIFGGFTDKSGTRKDTSSENRLLVKGAALFGGVEVNNKTSPGETTQE